MKKNNKKGLKMCVICGIRPIKIQSVGKTCGLKSCVKKNKSINDSLRKKLLRETTKKPLKKVITEVSKKSEKKVVKKEVIVLGLCPICNKKSLKFSWSKTCGDKVCQDKNKKKYDEERKEKRRKEKLQAKGLSVNKQEFIKKFNFFKIIEKND